MTASSSSTSASTAAEVESTVGGHILIEDRKKRDERAEAAADESAIFIFVPIVTRDGPPLLECEMSASSPIVIVKAASLRGIAALSRVMLDTAPAIAAERSALSLMISHCDCRRRESSSLQREWSLLHFGQWSLFRNAVILSTLAIVGIKLGHLAICRGKGLHAIA